MTTSELFLPYRDEVLALARKIAPTHADADDLVSLTYETLARNVAAPVANEKRRAFVLGVCANLGKHLRRANSRRERVLGELERGAVTGLAEDPESLLLRQELAEHLASAIETLPDAQRVAFQLAEIEDRPVAEVSQLVGAPEGTVRSRLFHARKRLRAYELLRTALVLFVLLASATASWAAYTWRAELVKVVENLWRELMPVPTPVQPRSEPVRLHPTGAIHQEPRERQERPLPATPKAELQPAKPVVAQHETVKALPKPVAPAEQAEEPAADVIAVTRHQVEVAHPALSGRELYERARQLQLSARDDVAAVAAWSEYLRLLPGGRYADEARYERAVALIRLGRDEEALPELKRFAAQPSGSFRRTEALRLLESLEDAAVH